MPTNEPSQRKWPRKRSKPGCGNALVVCDVPLVADALQTLTERTTGARVSMAQSWSDARQSLGEDLYTLVVVCCLGASAREISALDRLYRPQRWLLLPLQPSESLSALANDRRQISMTAFASSIEDLSRVLASTNGAQAVGSQADASAMPSLTPRQHALLTLLSQGHSTQEIAQRLRIQPGTVRNGLSKAYQKLGVQDRTSAALTYQAVFNPQNGSAAI